MKRYILALTGLFSIVGLSQAKANIEVATCIEFDTCYYSQTPTPFSDSLSLSDLTTLGLGSTKSLFVVQTSPFIIRLGETTFNFATSSGQVIETLPEFNGPSSQTSQILTVGNLFIPTDALSAMVTGSFGNSVVPNSAGANVFFGVSPVPLPASLPMFGAALLGLGAVGYGMGRRGKKETAASVT